MVGYLMVGERPLQRFFAFVDARGGGTFSRTEVEYTLGSDPAARDLLRALLRADILSKAPYATTIECLEERRGCRGFDVREVGGRHRPELAGVCTANRRPCSDFVIEDEVQILGRVTLSIRSLALALCRVFEVDGASDLENEDALMTLGEHEGEGQNPRNVYFWASPDYQVVTPLLAKLERARRASLVLIPVRAPLFALFRDSHGPDSHVQIAFLEERVVLREGRLALRADAPPSGNDASERPPAVISSPRGTKRSRPKAAVAHGTVTLALDCEREAGAMVITVNGARWSIPDRHFALVVKLISAQLSKPNAWSSYRDVQIHDVHAATWHANRAFDGTVPEGFNVILNDRKRQCRLNPAVVVEPVDWASVMAHPYEAVRKLAEKHLAASRDGVRGAGE